jgi:phosphopantetheinyl transferase
MPGVCAIALVDRRELRLGRWTALLSDRERAETATYRHPARRAKALTSRVLTKYLVLHPELSEFRRLVASEIEAIKSSEWESVERLSGTAHARRGVSICRGGTVLPDLSASSSHCGPYTAACISHRCHIGLDLERIEPRRQEFYTHTFSAEEKDWAAGIRGHAGASLEAAFTLLWSVKEAYLKASGRHDLSVWTFPRWTVWFDGAVDEVLQPEPDERFVRVPGGIHSPGFSQSFEIAATRVDDMILATVQYREAASLASNVRSAE